MKEHSERKHSKFAASGAERWFECSASVEASEGQPDKNTEWSIEGTIAHEVLEAILLLLIAVKTVSFLMFKDKKGVNKVMYRHALSAAEFIFKKGQELKAEVLVETRIYLSFIHEAAFGTFDGAILDHFGTLHVFDFKYGAGHAVSPKENLQMIFYALGLAFKYNWNFERVRLWIIQPRIKGYDGPAYWEISIEHLMAYIPKYKEAVWRVENDPQFKEGSWCHWCKAKKVCPLKDEKRRDKATEIFKPIMKGPTNGQKESKEKSGKDQGKDPYQEIAEDNFKSEADWKKESKEGKAKKAQSRRLGKPRVLGAAYGTGSGNFC